LLKGFLPFVEGLTQRLRRSTEEFAQAAGRPVRYLESKVDKEELVERIRDAASLAELYPLLTRHGMETFQSPDVLRVESTLNDPKGLKVYRSKQDDPEGPKQWLPLRKSVADLARRAELSQSANERYLEALGRLDADTPLGALTDKLCRPVEVGKRRHRGLRPFDPEEVRLLEIISRGEYEIAGFRNRDVRRAMLRAHGSIKKIPRTHRYLLTTQGRTQSIPASAHRRPKMRTEQHQTA
jgi:hypothetical protein